MEAAHSPQIDAWRRKKTAGQALYADGELVTCGPIKRDWGILQRFS